MTIKIKGTDTFKQRVFAVEAIDHFEKHWRERHGRNESVVYTFKDSLRNRRMHFNVYRTDTQVIADMTMNYADPD